MKFPEAPTCHDIEPVFRGKDLDLHWRDPRKDENFRTCNYCGSIHPEDFINALRNGATCELADFKYGWPHKVYLEIPNTENPDELVEMGGSTRGFDEPCPNCCGPDGKARPDLLVAETKACPCHGCLRKTEFTPLMGTRKTFHAKWYNDHIKDEGYDDEAFQLLVNAIRTRLKIDFVLEKDTGLLKYRRI